jgi:hypothetical protein
VIYGIIARKAYGLLFLLRRKYRQSLRYLTPRKFCCVSPAPKVRQNPQIADFVGDGDFL